MRRLAVLAVLLVCPAVANADGLPGTASYPLWGCSTTGYCFTAGIVQVGKPLLLTPRRFWPSG